MKLIYVTLLNLFILNLNSSSIAQEVVIPGYTFPDNQTTHTQSPVIINKNTPISAQPLQGQPNNAMPQSVTIPSATSNENPTTIIVTPASDGTSATAVTLPSTNATVTKNGATAIETTSGAPTKQTTPDAIATQTPTDATTTQTPTDATTTQTTSGTATTQTTSKEGITTAETTPSSDSTSQQPSPVNNACPDFLKTAATLAEVQNRLQPAYAISKKLSGTLYNLAGITFTMSNNGLKLSLETIAPDNPYKEKLMKAKTISEAQAIVGQRAFIFGNTFMFVEADKVNDPLAKEKFTVSTNLAGRVIAVEVNGKLCPR